MCVCAMNNKDGTCSPDIEGCNAKLVCRRMHLEGSALPTVRALQQCVLLEYHRPIQTDNKRQTYIHTHSPSFASSPPPHRTSQRRKPKPSEAGAVCTHSAPTSLKLSRPAIQIVQPQFLEAFPATNLTNTPDTSGLEQPHNIIYYTHLVLDYYFPR